MADNTSVGQRWWRAAMVIVSLSLLALSLSGCSLFGGSSEYSLLIIGPQAYAEPIQSYAQFKSSQAVENKFVSVEEITDAYEGVDLAEKIRNCIRTEHESFGPNYVLLAGDVDQIPTRYLFNPSNYVPQLYAALDDPALSEAERADVREQIAEMEKVVNNCDIAGCYVASDFYYANLYADWDANGNGVYGESHYFTGEADEGDFTVDVYVGRIPAQSVEELDMVVKKLKNFKGWWSTKQGPLFVGMTDAGAEKILDAEAILDQLDSRGLAKQKATALVEDDASLTFPALIEQLNQNYPMVLMAVRGLPYALAINGAYRETYRGALKDPHSFKGLKDAEAIYANTEDELVPEDRGYVFRQDVQDLTNERLYFLLLDADLAGEFDYPWGQSIAETFLMQKQGAMGVVAESRLRFGPADAIREGYTQQTGGLFTEYAPDIIHRIYTENQSIGQALYQAKVDYAQKHSDLMGEEYQRRAIWGYNLFGDPSITVFTKRVNFE